MSSNLKVVLGSEGFKDIELRYLGGLWVMIGFNSEDTKAKFCHVWELCHGSLKSIKRLLILF